VTGRSNATSHHAIAQHPTSPSFLSGGAWHHDMIMMIIIAMGYFILAWLLT